MLQASQKKKKNHAKINQQALCDKNDSYGPSDWSTQSSHAQIQKYSKYDDKYVHRYDKHFKENDFNR